MAPLTRRGAKNNPDTEGLKIAQEIAHEAEEALGVGHLDPIVGDEPSAKEKVPEGEDATVWCFAYGSNMNKAVLEGRRMISPAESIAAVCLGYKLSFNQPGLPFREPGFATVEPLVDGEKGPECHGVAHRMTPTEWEYYKESEGAAGQSDQGYGVIEVELKSYDGRSIKAYTLMTQAKTLARLKGRLALPSKRYLNLLRTGAEEHKLAPDYQRYLQEMNHYEVVGLGAKIGSLLTSFIAFGMLFPMFAIMRTYRKLRGLQSVKSGGFVSRFQSAWFHFVFALAWGLHDYVLSPILGSGCSINSS